MNVLKGLFLIISGLSVLVGGVTIGLAWLGICFGTVVIGILLLLLFPTILFLPFSTSFTLGGGLVAAGVLCMKA